MKFMRLILLCVIAMNFSVTASNEVIFVESNSEVEKQLASFDFIDSKTEQRAINLAKQLRCPQCQNQNLLESNSPVAMDLRLLVYQQVNQGRSDQQVSEFLVARYGEFVLYQPKMSANNLLLWGIPFLLMAGIALLSLLLLKRKSSSSS
ncbi:cytochrome c-type biogenesis protein [Vibrio sonorensis]|uniref:cytochrome c-type biogenesis protein n=1 Tax=Vibrio sonorensis TaxID=1004316 RepID=UPI000A6E34AA|nr:cytochrome c-type biogenesis protein [Vibrio sonorensis]